MSTDISTVTTKGQLVIPARLRRKFGIRKGTQIAFLEENQRLVLQPITVEYLRRLRGSFKHAAAALEILYAERRRERKL